MLGKPLAGCTCLVLHLPIGSAPLKLPRAKPKFNKVKMKLHRGRSPMHHGLEFLEPGLVLQLAAPVNLS